TKEVGEGTGVGLAFSHRIVKSHGGELSLRSDSGRGARFYIKLKAVEASSTGATIPDTLPQNFGRHSVLVVDDEVGVARLTHDLLVEAGFVVTQCTNPRDALAILEGHSFDAVLSDFKMPDMDGEEFFNAMKVVAPECVDRIGFITGDAMSRNVTRFFEKSRRPYIEKPIMKDELLALAVQLCRGDAQRH
ncbi:MAG: response regulator, partial [Pseudomonadota bacterium]